MTKKYYQIYRQELLEEIIPFWENYSADREFGGYFTCLLSDGQVYDTDKFVWLQARQLWVFTKLYQELDKREAWKEMALLGADFLQQHGRDKDGNWYFSLTRTGQPLVQPYNIFSDCFAAMAFGNLYRITGDENHKNIAISTYENILDRQNNPKGKYNKLFPGTRTLKNFALPMILCNLALELEHLIGKAEVDSLTTNITALILNQFYQADLGLVLENISEKGTLVDSFEGRLVNPGHAIEAMWFIMNIGLRQNNQKLVTKAEEIMFKQLEFGWDKQYGGIFYFMDSKGYPPQQLEWNHKLWWVHLEALTALAKSYACNKNPLAMEWFLKVHNYSWGHFRDASKGGEWFGYLNRQGAVQLDLKGGKWKGCFHVPRAMLEIMKSFKE